MSSEDIPSTRHRQTRSVAIPSTTPPSQHPRNPHHLDSQTQTQNITSSMNYPAQPSTPPRTPRRNNQPQNAATSTVRENGSKQKPRNKKNKPQNVTTSPAVNGQDRNTPPLGGTPSAGLSSSAKPMNTPSAAIFAGATFHASPAPSALPIPSFYSRSVPDSSGLKDLKSVKDVSVTGTGSQTPPVVPFLANNVHREESPLDIFFNARQEGQRTGAKCQFYKSYCSSYWPISPSPSESSKCANPSSTRQPATPRS